MTIIIPAAILNSFDKNNRIFPTAEAVTPKAIKTSENPKENKIVLYNTIFLSCSISSKFLSVIYDIYPGIIGNTHGVRKLINPAPKAKISLIIIVSLYLPLLFLAITILAHDS